MLKKFSNPISPFDFYFREAPGDEGDSVSVTVAPRQNRGTDYNDDTNAVTVGPRANRGTDYGADDTEPADTTPAPTQPDTGDDTGTDYTADDTGGDAAPATTEPPPTAPDTGDNTPDDGATDYGADTGGDQGDAGDAGGADAAGDEGADGDAPDGPDTGDGDDGATDYSADGGEGGEGGGDEGGGDTGDTGGEEMSEEDKVEASKKFHMYKRFMHLYNILEVFIEKCRNIVKPDAAQNAVIKTVANNLSDLYDNLFDYMTIKYKTATYIQILLYFETAISIIQLNFELLKNNKINLKQ